ncbi:hypothetical protein NH340_JMT06896 [Sarcoptes scabiei]|nr:hypothetical protein NH340_JMT06896 [Sarcoptes scabiei]
MDSKMFHSTTKISSLTLLSIWSISSMISMAILIKNPSIFKSNLKNSFPIVRANAATKSILNNLANSKSKSKSSQRLDLMLSKTFVDLKFPLDQLDQLDFPKEVLDSLSSTSSSSSIPLSSKSYENNQNLFMPVPHSSIDSMIHYEKIPLSTLVQDSDHRNLYSLAADLLLSQTIQQFDGDLMQMSDSNEHQSLEETAHQSNRYQLDSMENEDTNIGVGGEAKKTSEGILLGQPITNNFEGKNYVPVFYPVSWLQNQKHIDINFDQWNHFSPPSFTNLMASISYPVYSQQLESFVGETFGEKNQHLDDYDDFLLSQLDKSLNKVQQQSKSNRLNFYDDQWRFDHSRLPYKNRNPKQTSKINSNILKLYQPYPLEHIGGKFYLGPPVIHLKDSELETKLVLEERRKMQKEFASELMENDLLNFYATNLEDSHKNYDEFEDLPSSMPPRMTSSNTSMEDFLWLPKSNLQTSQTHSNIQHLEDSNSTGSSNLSPIDTEIIANNSVSTTTSATTTIEESTMTTTTTTKSDFNVKPEFPKSLLFY